MSADEHISGFCDMATFHTTIQLNGKTATGIQVPAEVALALGSSKKPAVVVTINGYSYRSTIATMGGVFMLPVSAEVRERAGVAAGATVDVEVVLDTAPREINIPADLAEALAGDVDAQRFFDGLGYSNKRNLVLQIEEAKSPETRARRIAKITGQLHTGQI
jgi:hypothetical protein